MVQVQGMLRCSVELAPRLSPAMHSLVMLPLSLDAPSPGQRWLDMQNPAGTAIVWEDFVWQLPEAG